MIMMNIYMCILFYKKYNKNKYFKKEKYILPESDIEKLLISLNNIIK